MAEVITMEDAKNLPTELSDLLGGAESNDDLSTGVSGGFSVISIRGSKWRVKHGGDETLITNDEGDARSAIRVVMLKANPHISKNYYANGFTEGSSDAPDCFSTDGKTPDPSVESPVSPQCASCPMNQFGSRITDTGSKAKACSDARRVAVIPEGDFANEQFGGPMLLRVPAASLKELATFGKAMKAKGYPYNTIVTKLAFDGETAYPRIKFQAARPLKQEEAGQIAELVRDQDFMDKINYILAEPIEVVEAEQAKAPAPAVQDPTEFEDDVPFDTEPAAAKPEAKAKAEPKAEVVAEAAEATVEAAEGDALGDDLDDILAKLDDLD